MLGLNAGSDLSTLAAGGKGLANCGVGAANCAISAGWDAAMSPLNPLGNVFSRFFSPPQVPQPFHGPGLDVSYGIGKHVVGPAGLALAGTARSATSDAAPSARLYLDVTSKTARGSVSVRNVATTTTRAEFADTLGANGWASRQVGADGATLFERSGAKYVLRLKNRSGWPGWTADFTPAGGKKALEIRLGMFAEVR